jgi:hypothetical protein
LLRFFRINDPYRLLFIFILLVLIRLVQSYFIQDMSYMELKSLLLGQWLDSGFQMYTEAYDYTGPLAVLVYKYLNFLFGRSAFLHHALSTLLIIVQAGIFNQLLLKNKAYNENNYLPALFYMILMVSVPDFMALSPQLLSLTFILLALKNVLRRIDNQATDELFLNSGISIGIATMIHLPSAVFLLVFLFSLILFSTAVTRRLLLYLFGFLLIFGLTYLFYYWQGDHYHFVESFIIENLAMKSSAMLTFRELFLLSSGFLFVFLLAVFKTIGSARLTNFQQKIQQVIWLMLFGAIAVFLLSNEDAGLELVFVVPVIAYFLTHYFMLLRKRIFKAIMPVFIVFGLLAFSGLVYKKWSEPLLVHSKDLQSENGMVLGADLNYYVNTSAGSPCFTEALSLKAFEGLDYYGGATRFYELLEQANPNVIIDEMDISDRIFERFPTLQEKYVKVGENRYRRISN